MSTTEIDTVAKAMRAVKADGLTLKSVPEVLKSKEVCNAAVRQNWRAHTAVPQALQTTRLSKLVDKLMEDEHLNGGLEFENAERERERNRELDEEVREARLQYEARA